jgi:hypothetical protein
MKIAISTCHKLKREIITYFYDSFQAIYDEIIISCIFKFVVMTFNLRILPFLQKGLLEIPHE